jgi:effector-binding domain-containing protein
MTIRNEVIDCVLPGQRTAVIHAQIPRGALRGWLNDAYPTVLAGLRRLDIEPVGPPFARYTFLGDQVAVEAGYPVAGGFDGDGRVESSRLPAGRAAMTTHIGRYEDLDRTYAYLKRWLCTHGDAPIGTHWEVYHRDAGATCDPATWRTDVVVAYRVG